LNSSSLTTSFSLPCIPADCQGTVDVPPHATQDRFNPLKLCIRREISSAYAALNLGGILSGSVSLETG
jgi:hypothetical protein